MKFLMSSRITLFLATTFVFVTSFFLADFVRNDQSNLKFNKVVQELLAAQVGKTDSVYFTFTNTSNTALKIESISSRCDCTIPEFKVKNLAKGRLDSILVLFTPSEMGYFKTEIIVESNSATSPDALYITGVAE
jgi:hypothetical protein